MVLTNLIPNFNEMMKCYHTQERFEGERSSSFFRSLLIAIVNILALAMSLYLAYPCSQVYSGIIKLVYMLAAGVLYWPYLIYYFIFKYMAGISC